MAQIWEQHNEGYHYEVRTAGSSLRLYRDGVLHTQYNTKRLLTLGVWDLLLLPALAVGDAGPKRVLVLGVGGGAILRLYSDFFPGVELTGVDLDPMHLQIARQFFGIEQTEATLIAAEAQEWLGSYTGERFDLVIDDMFDGSDADPKKVFAPDKPWFDRLLSVLKPDGMLVMNFASMRDLAKSAWLRDRKLRRDLPGAVALEMPSYGNAVAAYSGLPLNAADVRAAVGLRAEFQRGDGKQLMFSVRTLRPRV